MKLLVLVLLGLATACIDFGYDVAVPQDDADAQSDSDAPAGCTEGVQAPSSAGPQLAYASFTVDNPSLTIQAGDTVTWTNNDAVPHTVTEGVPNAPSGIDSGDIAASGGQWAYKFCTPRNLVYYCKPHQATMNGYVLKVE